MSIKIALIGNPNFGENNLSRRIMEMGLTSGVKVFIKNLAPFW